MVKREEDLAKRQPWFTALSRGWAPLVCEVPKLGGSAEVEKGESGWGGQAGTEGDGETEAETQAERQTETDRRRLRASAVGWEM